jgi:GntR family transcriptional regulator, transcriptional repressor for pyruvate dehydrogenase complex
MARRGKNASSVSTPAHPDFRRNALTSNGRSCIAIAPSGAITRQLKTSETVARDVVHDIIANHLQPGDGLMPETAMLEQYGVSRESLREGLRLLEVQGLISIRRGPGGGPVVGTVDPAHLGRISTLYYHLAGATYRELFEAWVLGESILAERAARNPDSAARAAAMKPYLTDDKPAAVDIEDFVQVHSGFHSALASLTRNRVLELSLQTMGQIVAHHVAVTGDPRELRELIEESHHEVARAVIGGHPQRARRLMEQHIETLCTLYEGSMGDQLDDYIEWR